MSDHSDIENLKIDIASPDYHVVRGAVNRLFAIGGQDNIDFLIGLLDQDNSLVRNEVALTFSENKFNDAIEPLLDAINKPENKDARGTMVYALEALDCSKKLKEIFQILFSAPRNVEAQHAVLTILEEQEFEFTRSDLIEIRERWENLKMNWNELSGIKDQGEKRFRLDRDNVQGLVDGFISYLDNVSDL